MYIYVYIENPYIYIYKLYKYTYCTFISSKMCWSFNSHEVLYEFGAAAPPLFWCATNLEWASVWWKVFEIPQELAISCLNHPSLRRYPCCLKHTQAWREKSCCYSKTTTLPLTLETLVIQICQNNYFLHLTSSRLDTSTEKMQLKPYKFSMHNTVWYRLYSHHLSRDQNYRVTKAVMSKSYRFR